MRKKFLSDTLAKYLNINKSVKLNCYFKVLILFSWFLWAKHTIQYSCVNKLWANPNCYDKYLLCVCIEIQ